MAEVDGMEAGLPGAEGEDVEAGDEASPAASTVKKDAWEPLQLPAAVVSRIVKRVLQSQSETVRVEKAALESLSRCVSISLLYVADAAASLAAQAKRKTVTASDVFAALECLQLGEVAAQVKTTCQTAARTPSAAVESESSVSAAAAAADSAELQGAAEASSVSDSIDLTADKQVPCDSGLLEQPVHMEEDEPYDPHQVQVDALNRLLDEESGNLPFHV